MAVTDQQRRQLYTGLVDRIGQENAETLMELLPPFDPNDIATKSDIANLRGELRGEFGDLRGEFGELRGEFGELRAEMAQLKADLFEHTQQLQRTYATWLLAGLGVVLAMFTTVTAIG